MKAIFLPHYRLFVLFIPILISGLTGCATPRSLHENGNRLASLTPTGFFTPQSTDIVSQITKTPVITTATGMPTLTFTTTMKGSSTETPDTWGGEIIPTRTPGPTPTALFLVENGKDDCVKLPGLPEDLTVTFHPFCVFWSDSFPDETGFELILEYSYIDQIYEIFVFQTKADVTSLRIPETFAPRIEESREQCRKRKDFVLILNVLQEGKKKYVTELAQVSQCNFQALPTATPDS
ncbi:MAG: hypothetical protein ROW52_11470 [Anaerolineaceae bacterium]